MFYFDLLEALYKNKIKYLIVGGFALNLHGVPRVTNDIDIIISMDKENINKVNEILNNLGYIPRLPENPDDIADPHKLKERIDNKNLTAFGFYNKNEPYKSVDIILDHPLNFEKAFQNKSIKKVTNIEIPLVSIEDLIKMKEKSNRNQDSSDINMLNKLKTFMENSDV